jgi:hypothetical protein
MLICSNDGFTGLAGLNGAAEVPPVETQATGKVRFALNHDGSGLTYKLIVHAIEGVTQAHIHLGSASENGPPVAFLFGPVDPTGSVNGRLARGTVTEADLLGPFEGDFGGFLDALRSGDLYVNLHTSAVPSGEIRGQIGAH